MMDCKFVVCEFFQHLSFLSALRIVPEPTGIMLSGGASEYEPAASEACGV
jgi:hypothetical protein